MVKHSSRVLERVAERWQEAGFQTLCLLRQHLKRAARAFVGAQQW